MDISPVVLAVVIVAAFAVLAGVWFALRRKRSRDLRERFGPEYERVVRSADDRRHAEERLVERERRVEKLSLRPLSREERNRFSQRWRVVQARFVDDPSSAVEDGDRLIQEAMKARGYPVGDFERRAADLSVDHALVVQNYREARDIAERNRRGEASTEDLRRALVHQRSLFEELLEQPGLVEEVRHAG